MNAPRFAAVRCALIVCLACTLLAVAAPTTFAAETAAVVPAVLPAFDLQSIVHDRARLIQCSLVAVGIGIAMLWWGNKTN
jgi:hypothetical protein